MSDVYIQPLCTIVDGTNWAALGQPSRLSLLATAVWRDVATCLPNVGYVTCNYAPHFTESVRNQTWCPCKQGWWAEVREKLCQGVMSPELYIHVALARTVTSDQPLGSHRYIVTCNLNYIICSHFTGQIYNTSYIIIATGYILSRWQSCNIHTAYE